MPCHGLCLMSKILAYVILFRFIVHTQGRAKLQWQKLLIIYSFRSCLFMQALYTRKLIFRPRSSSVVAPFHPRHLDSQIHYSPMVRKIDLLCFLAAISCSLSNDKYKQSAPPMQVVVSTVVSRAYPRLLRASKETRKPAFTCLRLLCLTSRVAVQLQNDSEEFQLTFLASNLITKASRLSSPTVWVISKMTSARTGYAEISYSHYLITQ